MISSTFSQASIRYNPNFHSEIAMRLIDRVGDRYERLKVIARAPNKGGKDTNARWVCRCDCGNEITAYGGDLQRGKVKSCGCWNDERTAAMGRKNLRHGMTNTRIFRIWSMMLTRCENPNKDNYASYGGRGISVCERWHTFENFVNDMGVPEPDLSLDRIDGDGNYCKENCRWATAREQALNRRNAKKLTHRGMTLTLSEWATVLGVTPATMYTRLHRKYPPEKLFARSTK